MTELVTPAAEILATVLADEGTAVVLGWIDRTLPEHGTLCGGDTAEAIGTAKVLVWPRSLEDDSTSYWFLAVLESEGGAAAILDKPALLSPNGRIRYALPPLGRLSLDGAELLSRAAPLVVDEGVALVGFLQESLDAQSSRGRSALLFGALRTFARPDGFVEIFGRVDGSVLLMQGWSVNLAAGTAEIILETEGCQRHSVTVATHDRADLGGTAHGVLALLQDGQGVDPRKISRVYFRREQVWRQLEIFENRIFLTAQASGPHLKGLFPSLRMEAGTARLFKRLCGNRFEGHETLSSLDRPVRAALDLAVFVPEGGIFLTGWLLDPARQVAAVTLRGNGVHKRLDDIWNRTPRPDVSQGYGQDALFAGRLLPGDDAHGFVVAVPCPLTEVDGADLHLEILLADDEAVFLPVNAAQPSSRAVLHRILSSFNIDDPAAENIVRQQIGPIVTASARRLPSRMRPPQVCAFGQAERKPRISAVIPVLNNGAQFDINLARFAVDPEFAGVELVVVAPTAQATALGGLLQRQARFYGLSGRLVLSTEELDACEAMELGAQHATGELVLFLSASVFPKKPGWLSPLAQGLLSHAKAGAISPTLLYEDDSIRFAGQKPGKAATGLHGYSRHWLSGKTNAGPVAVQTGSIDCCLMVRRLFLELGGFAKDYVGGELKGPDLFLKLRAAKLDVLWMPAVEMVGLDEAEDIHAAPYWRQTGRLVDRWGFSRKWSQTSAALVQL